MREGKKLGNFLDYNFDIYIYICIESFVNFLSYVYVCNVIFYCNRIF